MLSDRQLAQLQLVAYEYPDANGVRTPFAWDWVTNLGDIRAGLKREGDDQVLIFPGTGGGVDEAETLRQWALNFSAVLVPELKHPRWGWIVAGFYDQLENFMAEALGQIDHTKPLYLIGHSRGGAQCQLAAAWLKDCGVPISRIVAFAPPRPAQQALFDYLNDIPGVGYEAVDDVAVLHDYVCDVPPWGREGVRMKSVRVIAAPRDKWGPFACHHIEGYANSPDMPG